VILVAPVRLSPNPGTYPEVEVDCFSSSGGLLWSYVPKEEFRFGDHEIRGPWAITDVLVSGGGKHVIFVSVVHPEWGNSFVAALDPLRGKAVVCFVNTGTIQQLGEIGISGTTYLLAGGFNNESDSPSLAVMNERKDFAASPQTSGTRHVCVSCPSGVPDYYFVFRNSEISRIRHTHHEYVRRLRNSAEGEFEAVVSEDDDRDAARIFLFQIEPTVHAETLRFSSTYDSHHEDFEHGGKLTHSLRDCPERLHPAPLRAWTANAGWTELNLSPHGADQ